MLTKADVLLVTMAFATLDPKQTPSYFDIPEPGVLKEYDYVIVGGGSAGTVLANRLSQDRSHKVLLLEAGGIEDAVTDIPLFTPLSLRTEMDWGIQFETQEKAAHAFEDKRSWLVAGKVLGGGSVMNYMIYNRGNRRDYDRWARNGAKGWSFDDVLPYFMKSEDNQDASMVANGYHGTGGELTVASNSFTTDTLKTFLEAGKELGYDTVDVNGPQQTGFAQCQTTTKDKQRWSTSKAFLFPVGGKHGRKNLHVSLFSTATKILFEKNRAVGVVFKRENETYTVKARKEVILSAGVIHSPKLLLLSGIGPKQHLQEMKIRVLADLPVGENLQDHALVGGFAVHLNRTSLDTGPAGVLSALQYYRSGTGLWTIPGGVEGLAFVNTKYANKTDDHPDVEIMLHIMGPTGSYGEAFLRGTGLKQEVYDKYFRPFRERASFTLLPMVLRPKSRGYVKLRSKDPEDLPVVNPMYYTHDDDAKIIVEGLKICHKLVETRAFKSFGASLWSRPFPGCEEHEQFSDKYWECLARSFASTAYHPSGTCKMGNDNTAVVDHRLRVRGGIKGLRVVDASVMPDELSGHLNAPVIMIAEKAADIILEDNHKQKHRFHYANSYNSGGSGSGSFRGNVVLTTAVLQMVIAFVHRHRSLL